MEDKVAIIGVGQTRQQRHNTSQNYAEMAYEAVRAALDDAGLEIEDIDNIVTVSNDFWDGRTISSMAVNDAAGSYEKNVSTVEEDGAFGAFYGMTRIQSGSYGTTLVLAHGKGSEGDMHLITNGMFDPIYNRGTGIDATISGALQARVYMEEFGVTEEDLARVSVKNHRNALKNPNAQVAKDVSIEDVMKSKKLADPLKIFDVSPISDGAACVILAGEKAIPKSKQKPVYLQGVGMCMDNYKLGERDLARAPALKKAAENAYKMAGIKNPLEELDVAEIYEAYSYMELMWYEGLGLCEEGKGAELIKSGATEMDGKLPVNPSGGILSAHTVIAGGLIRMIEAALQLRGDAGERQVAGAKKALAHGIGGPCGQNHIVWVLGTEN